MPLTTRGRCTPGTRAASTLAAPEARKSHHDIIASMRSVAADSCYHHHCKILHLRRQQASTCRLHCEKCRFCKRAPISQFLNAGETFSAVTMCTRENALNFSFKAIWQDSRRHLHQISRYAQRWLARQKTVKFLQLQRNE